MKMQQKKIWKKKRNVMKKQNTDMQGTVKINNKDLELDTRPKKITKRKR